MRYKVVMHCGFSRETQVGPLWDTVEDAITARDEQFTEQERRELNVDIVGENSIVCDWL